MCRRRRRKSQTWTFIVSGTPVCRTERRKYQQHVRSGFLGLLCAEQSVGNPFCHVFVGSPTIHVMVKYVGDELKSIGGVIWGRHKGSKSAKTPTVGSCGLLWSIILGSWSGGSSGRPLGDFGSTLYSCEGLEVILGTFWMGLAREGILISWHQLGCLAALLAPA